MLGFKKKDLHNTISLSITGMHCPSCAMNIDGGLEELTGVSSATTSYAKAETKIEYNREKVSRNELIAAIEKAGYKVINR